MNTYSILFIDDEANKDGSSRKQLIDSLQKDPRFEVDAYHPEDFLDQLKENKNAFSKKLTLIIVDYRLRSHGNANGTLCSSNGYSITSLCREKFPETPVYLISQILENDISNSDHYDKMISQAFLTKEEGRLRLYSDCSSYNSLLEPNPSLENLFKLPEEDKDSFLEALPFEFKNFSIKQNTHESHKVLDREYPNIRFAKWVNQTLLTRSGPLISQEELYMTFGLKSSEQCLNQLDKYKEQIERCKYKGIFSNEQQPRWWAQSIFNLASSEVHVENQVMPWKEIPTNLDYPEECISTCVVCGDKLPECIAYDSHDDIQLVDGRPAHWRCTSPSSNYEDITGFNPILILDDL